LVVSVTRLEHALHAKGQFNGVKLVMQKYFEAEQAEPMILLCLPISLALIYTSLNALVLWGEHTP